MAALGYGPLASSNLAFACYAAVFLLNRLYLPTLLVFAGADAVLSHSFLRETVLGDAGLPFVLMVVGECWCMVCESFLCVSFRLL